MTDRTAALRCSRCPHMDKLSVSLCVMQGDFRTCWLIITRLLFIFSGKVSASHTIKNFTDYTQIQCFGETKTPPEKPDV